MTIKKQLKRWYVAAYVSAAMVVMGGGTAFAANITIPSDPTGIAGNILGSNNGLNNVGSSGGGNSAWTDVGKFIEKAVGLAGGLVLAYTIIELYHAAALFMGGGSNAQKRELAKSHLVHVGFGAILVGGAGVIVMALFGVLGGI